MAQPMKLFLSFLTLAASLLWLPALAQQLQDPTRPSKQLMQAGAMTDVDGEPVLQSVFISPTRRTAIISGQSVKLGEKFNDATLIRVTESEVVLRNGGELQTLKLFPSIGKRVTSNHGRKNPDNRN